MFGVTIALLAQHAIPTIRGNHDRWAIREGHCSEGVELTPGAVAFLESLPASYTVTLDGVRIAVWHGRPGSDMQGIYPDVPAEDLAGLLDRAECDVLVVGHTHLAFCLPVSGGRLVCNPGALLRTPPPDTAQVVILGGRAQLAPAYGSYGVLDAGARTFTVHTVEAGA